MIREFQKRDTGGMRLKYRVSFLFGAILLAVPVAMLIHAIFLKGGFVMGLIFAPMWVMLWLAYVSLDYWHCWMLNQLDNEEGK